MIYGIYSQNNDPLKNRSVIIVRFGIMLVYYIE